MANVGEMMGFGLGLQLREHMDGSDRLLRWKTFRIRLGFNGCCGATWGFGDMAVRDDDVIGGGEEEDGGSSVVESANEQVNAGENFPASGSTPACGGGMNLAEALAVEREFRSAQEADGLIRSPIHGGDTVGAGTRKEARTPLRVSLMKLLEETDGCDEASDSTCCVCMVRKKGAAFIPCGHTFCRVCTRELWLSRGSCPLCNRSITEVLDIF